MKDYLRFYSMNNLINKADARVLLVFGTRPELIKLSPLLIRIREAGLNDQFLIVSTAQHDELLKAQEQVWGVVPDIVFATRNKKDNLTRLLANTLTQLQDVVEQYQKLEYVLVQGDTNTALACANLAFLNDKKLLHVEAGLRTHDLKHPFPEEYNRLITSRAAYFHFVPSTYSKANLLAEGVPEDRILVTGNTIVDALQMVTLKHATKPEGKKVLITMHRRENGAQIVNLKEIVGELSNRYPSLEFTWIIHPSYSTTFIEDLKRLCRLEVKNFLPYDDFVQLYSSAAFVITDSGGVTEEAAQLGIPTIVFRGETERIEPAAMGLPVLVSQSYGEIVMFLTQFMGADRQPNQCFGQGDASIRILEWIQRELGELVVKTAIIGGGPAGTGTILKAMKDGEFEEYARDGLAIIEASHRLIAGSISEYRINSDTVSDVFLECLEGHTKKYLDLSQLFAEVQHVRNFSGKSIPLRYLDEYFTRLSALLRAYLESHPKCALFLNTMAQQVNIQPDGRFRVHLGNGKTILARKVILATGAKPMESLKKVCKFGGQVRLDPYLHKSMTSDAILRGQRRNQLANLPENSRIVILGGNHSAFSVAEYLLNNTEGFLTDCSIKVWARKKPKLYYASSCEAIGDGYRDFSEADICPVTKRVFRLAGLRMDGRRLYRHMLGLGTGSPEKRVSLNMFSESEDELLTDLHEADLVVHALGYELNMVSVKNEDNEDIVFLGSRTGYWVNDACEVLGDKGQSIPNLFAMGLASGFIPKGDLGGEPSFQGHTNGLWYYQNRTAELIIDQIKC
jgi:UDP-N-acetylglucosamine 2-epimerase (non-hydrolysing)